MNPYPSAGSSKCNGRAATVSCHVVAGKVFARVDDDLVRPVTGHVSSYFNSLVDADRSLEVLSDQSASTASVNEAASG
jgi:hypothetical protein